VRSKKEAVRCPCSCCLTTKVRLPDLDHRMDVGQVDDPKSSNFWKGHPNHSQVTFSDVTCFVEGADYHEKLEHQHDVSNRAGGNIAEDL